MSKFDYINESLLKFTKNDKPEFRWRQSARMLGELRFKLNKIRELAKPFINAQQMKDFVGENQEQIRQAGGYIMSRKVERPEWFEDILKNNSESLEECLEILNNNCTTSKEIYEKGYTRILNRLWTIFKLSGKEVRKLTPNIKWEIFDWDDNIIYDVLSQYEDNRALRNSKEDKFLITKMQIDKGKNYPKSYALYQSMIISPSEIRRPKRGNYQQRTPAIEKYDLNNNYIETFETWQEVITAGFNRNSVTNAIRGNDGHHKHKGFIWKYKK